MPVLVYSASTNAQALKELVSTLVGLMGVSYTTIDVTEGHRTVVAITTTQEDELVGQGGETMRALTMLARRMMERMHGEDAATFLIDVNGKQEAALEGVRQLARMQAQRARLFKQQVELEPMNPYERLVVHELFANDTEIKTESAGEGKQRHVVLKYSGPTK